MDTRLAVASKRDWRSYADRAVPEDVQERILDAGRLSGSGVNRQPWQFVVVESEDARNRVAETVFAGDNVRTCAFAVAVATEGRKFPLDVGRCIQNMMLAAWNDGVVSCPNGMPDEAAAAGVLGLENGFEPVNIVSFGYPKREQDSESKTADEWSAEANRKQLDELIRRI